MPAYNLHSRRLPVPVERAEPLLDGLAGVDDRLWPNDRWPRMAFDRPLGVGAVGGHGPVRYRVEEYVPGKWVRFRFTAPRGFDGFHEFVLRPLGEGESELRHLMALRLHVPAWFGYPLIWRPLHDALLEDCLDRAVTESGPPPVRPARWGWWVRLLRRFLR